MARTVSCWHLVLSWMAISNSSRSHNTRICVCSTQHPTNEVAGKLYSMKCDLTYTVCSSRCLIRELYNELREDPEFMLYGFLVLMYIHTFLILLSLQAWPDLSTPIVGHCTCGVYRSLVLALMNVLVCALLSLWSASSVQLVSCV